MALCTYVAHTPRHMPWRLILSCQPPANASLLAFRLLVYKQTSLLAGSILPVCLIFFYSFKLKILIIILLHALPWAHFYMYVCKLLYLFQSAFTEQVFFVWIILFSCHNIIYRLSRFSK